MKWIALRLVRRLTLLGVGATVVACAVYPPLPEPAPEPVQALQSCEPVATDEVLVGNWLNKRKVPGVMGELRTLFTLKANGEMLFNEQLKRPRQPSQGINEGGCWWREGDQLVLKTFTSNGVEVDASDPIYTNYYTIQHSSADKLALRASDGMEYSTERTSPGYRLPF